jgi:type IV pilus assembly protein PilV
MRASHASTRLKARGFSLVEVMVALVVCAIGLLGLAKMESLAVSSTKVAGARSLAAIEASSLAAAMHANPAYWSAGLAPAAPAQTTVTVTGSATAPVATFASPDSVLAGAATAAACNTPGSGSCAPNAMAAYDLQTWAQSLGQVLPGSFATITCSTLDLNPVTCTIEIQWTENAVAVNASQSNLANLQNSTYILYVQP